MHKDRKISDFIQLPVLEFQPEVNFQNFKRHDFLEFFADSNDRWMSAVSRLVWPGILPSP